MLSTYVKLFLMALFWGGTFIAGKVLTRTVGPFSGAFLRFAVACLCLTVLTLKTERRLPLPSRQNLLILLLMGLTGVFAYNVLFLKGLRLVEAGRASIIIANNPIFIALMAAVFFHERLNFLKLAGILTSVTGAVTVITRGDPRVILSGGIGWGEVLIFGCVASWVTYSLLGKRVMSELSPLVSVTYSALIGAAALLPPAIAEGVLKAPAYPLEAWASIVYLAFFATVLGFVWYYQGIQRIGPVRAGLFINFVPICAVLLSFLMLGEPLTVSLLVGAVLVSSGVYLTTLGSLRA